MTLPGRVDRSPTGPRGECGRRPRFQFLRLVVPLGLSYCHESIPPVIPLYNACAITHVTRHNGPQGADMGDKGGKKDKEKSKQQQVKKQKQEAQRKQDKARPPKV